jgi:hypothetical protein
MTNEQINQRIAEVCGWKLPGSPEHRKATDGWGFGYQFVIKPEGQLVTRNSIPDYCRSLDAMHEVENKMCKQEFYVYLRTLPSGPAAITATARQRAEAFLRTLGKWEEGE